MLIVPRHNGKPKMKANEGSWVGGSINSGDVPGRKDANDRDGYER